MGQKVNPIGFRTGIVMGWKSRWYASKKEFAELLVKTKRFASSSRIIQPSPHTARLGLIELRSSVPATKFV